MQLAINNVAANHETQRVKLYDETDRNFGVWEVSSSFFAGAVSEARSDAGSNLHLLHR